VRQSRLGQTGRLCLNFIVFPGY